MSYGSTHPARVGHPDTGAHIVTWILGVLGILAAAFGGWIELASSDASITVFDRTWAVADIDGFWGPTLLIAGGAVAALAMATAALRDWQHEVNRWLIGLEALLAVAGVAGVVIGIIALF